MPDTYKIFSLKSALISAIIVLFTGSSCLKDDVALDTFIDDRLQEYFDRFVTEAALRQFIVDFEVLKVSGHIRLITSHNVIGQCAHDPGTPTTVIIDKSYWDNSTDLEKEFLIFHELGHCILNRDHLNQSDPQGNCISIMTSGTAQCIINYTPATREGLIDELFMF